MSLRGEIIDPAKTALIVIDKQHGYFSPSFTEARGKHVPPEAPFVITALDNLVTAARSHDVPVFWTQMAENIEESPPAIVRQMLLSDTPAATVTDTKSYDFYGETRPADDEIVIPKMYYDAFNKTPLAQELHDRQLETVILVGGYATRCVLSSAIGANNHDFTVVVPEDCILNQEESRDEVPTLFKVVNAIHGVTVPSSQEIINIWDRQNK